MFCNKYSPGGVVFLSFLLHVRRPDNLDTVEMKAGQSLDKSDMLDIKCLRGPALDHMSSSHDPWKEQWRANLYKKAIEGDFP